MIKIILDAIRNCDLIKFDTIQRKDCFKFKYSKNKKQVPINQV